MNNLSDIFFSLDKILSDCDLNNIKGFVLYMEENLSGKAYERLRSLYGNLLGLKSLRSSQRRIALLSRLVPRKHDMCISSCMAFTREHIDLGNCLECNEA